MKRRMGIAVFAALLVELVNFFLLTPPIDVGYPPGTPWYIQLIGFEWIALHWSGFMTMDWFDRISGCQALNLPGGCGQIDGTVFFTLGFINTAVLFLCLTFVLHWLARKRAASSPAEAS